MGTLWLDAFEQDEELVKRYTETLAQAKNTISDAGAHIAETCVQPLNKAVFELAPVAGGANDGLTWSDPIVVKGGLQALLAHYQETLAKASLDDVVAKLDSTRKVKRFRSNFFHV